MVEQQKRKKTRKQSQKDEEEDELLSREHRMKKRHKTAASAPMHPPAMTSVPQRLKDLTKTDEDDEGLVQVALQKRKVVALVALAGKRGKKFQEISEPWVSLIPLRFQDI